MPTLNINMNPLQKKHSNTVNNSFSATNNPTISNFSQNLTNFLSFTELKIRVY